MNTDKDNRNDSKGKDEPYDEWYIVGNVKKFIMAEKKYKKAYRKLLTPLKKEFENEAKATAKWDESNTLLERKLSRSIERDEDFKQFFSQSKNLLATIRVIIPEQNRLHEALNAIRETAPTHFFMSFVCYHSAIMILSEFVHLHRMPDKFRIGIQLSRAADKHLKIDVVDYVKIIKNLVNHSKINWAIKTINEISKILGKRSKSLAKTKNKKVDVSYIPDGEERFPRWDVRNTAKGGTPARSRDCSARFRAS